MVSKLSVPNSRTNEIVYALLNLNWNRSGVAARYIRRHDHVAETHCRLEREASSTAHSLHHPSSCACEGNLVSRKWLTDAYPFIEPEYNNQMQIWFKLIFHWFAARRQCSWVEVGWKRGTNGKNMNYWWEKWAAFRLGVCFSLSKRHQLMMLRYSQMCDLWRLLGSHLGGCYRYCWRILLYGSLFIRICIALFRNDLFGWLCKGSRLYIHYNLLTLVFSQFCHNLE